MWGGVCCVGVWWSHSTWGEGGLAGSVPTFMTHSTTWRGLVDRLPLMSAEYAVCVGCVELLGWPLVCV